MSPQRPSLRPPLLLQGGLSALVDAHLLRWRCNQRQQWAPPHRKWRLKPASRVEGRRKWREIGGAASAERRISRTLCLLDTLQLTVYRRAQ